MSNNNKQAVPVWVISLVSQSQRRESIDIHLRSLGIRYEFVDAIDGRNLSESRLGQMLARGVHLPKGHVGCYLSHLEAYKRLLASGQSYGLVLEDDARLSPLAIPLLVEGIDAKQFDYCFLDCENFNHRGPVFYDRAAPMNLTREVIAYPLSDGPTAAHAYLITVGAAALRLRHAFPIEKPIDVYEQLPYGIRFAAVVEPRLAWLSEHARCSSTYDQQWPRKSGLLWTLRRHSWYGPIRDAVRLTRLRWAIDARRRVLNGQLPTGHQWVRLPRGKKIVSN